MKSLEVYDPALCCSSGACGPAPDQFLAAFASALENAKASGISVKRYNLAQEPLAFANKPEVKAVLEKHGESGLPLLFIDGELFFRSAYPSSEQLAQALGLSRTEDESCCGESEDCGSASSEKKPITFVKVEGPKPSSSACCDSASGCC